MYTGVSKGEDTTALCIHTKYLSQYLLLCVTVYVHAWVQVNTEFITTNSRVKTCNSDRFTRMQPQIYGCVCVYLHGCECVSKRDAMRDSGQACLCKSGRSQDSEHFFEPLVGKWQRSILWSQPGILNMCRPSSCQQVASVFQWSFRLVIRQAGVITLSISVQRRPWAELKGNKTKLWNFSLLVYWTLYIKLNSDVTKTGNAG